MSVEYLAAALHAPITPAARKLVLVGLANHADHAGRCWPSLAALASIAGINQRNVRNHLKALEADGWIERIPQFSDGRQITNTYRVTLQGSAPAAAGQGGGRTQPGGRSQATGGAVASDPPGAVAGDPPGAVAGDRGNRQEEPSGGTVIPAASRPPEAVGDADGGTPDQLTLTPEEPDPVAARVPARGGHADVPESKILEWEEAFPAIDVRAEVRALAQWAEDNPSRRKVNVISWISRRLSAKQEHGRGVQRRGGTVTPHPRSAEAVRSHNREVAQRWATGGRTDG